jgi:hypothetical protein
VTPPNDESRRKTLLSAAFRMPSVQTMVSRKSSITNAFVNAIIPAVPPKLEEIEQALVILGMDAADVRCAYCGNRKTEWDHLRPLVQDQRPTGYITEIANLVPSCAKCNQSKGNSDWQTWIMNPTAPHSPTKREVPDLAAKIARLEAYEQWRQPTRIDFEGILGTDVWAQYWSLWEAVNGELRKCQEVADGLRERITQALSRQGRRD